MASALLACGEDRGGAPATNVADTATASAPMPAHQVRMLMTESGQYVYEPAELTIRAGDRVRWVNASGGPHNVAFYPDRIPGGALEVLNAAMADRLGGQDLVGKLLMDDGATYDIVFAGAPEGTYEYVCTPHEMVGMKAKVIVVR